MACEVTRNGGLVCLSGEMNIYAAPVLKESLLAALRTNLIAASIDLSKVTEMDTAGLQLLLLARRLSMACGGELKIFNPSEPAREVLELCGLDKLIASLDSSEVIPASIATKRSTPTAKHRRLKRRTKS